MVPALPGKPFASRLPDPTPPEVRRLDAQQALITLAEPLGTNRLWNLMAHPCPYVGHAAAFALADLYVRTFEWTDSQPTDAFSDALLSSNEMVRAAAAQGLWYVGGPGSKEGERLLEALSDPAPVVRRAVSESLMMWAHGSLQWPGFEQALRRASLDPDPQVRSNVTRALRQLSEKPSSE